MCKITVVDSIMGSGKTSTLINMINEDTEGKYIYITPYLKEVERIKDKCKIKKFIDPINKGKGKMDSFDKLISKERNIVATHSLFKGVSEEVMELLRLGEYTLVLDEVMDVVGTYEIKKDDLSILLNEELIFIDDDGLITWNENKLDFDSTYNEIKLMCLNKSLFMVNDVILIWTFPVEVFKAFKKVYILTYLFDGQIQKYYYDLFNVDYEYKSAHYNTDTEKHELCDYRYRDDLTNIRELINLIPGDDKINRIGDGKFSLSKSWFSKNELLVEVLRKNTNNYFRNKIKSKNKDNMWCTFKDYRSKVSDPKYSKGFVSLGARATNEFVDKKTLAYCANIFLNPIEEHFFIKKGIEVDADTYALSEMLQWIWRSQIRRGDPINLYIPSERMRNLLLEWLN